MKEPKTKPPPPPPKTLKRSIRTAKGVKASLNKSLDKIRKTGKAKDALKKQIPDDQRYDKPEIYATDQVAEKGKYITHRAGGKTIDTAKKAGKKGYEKIREHRQTKQRDKSEKRFGCDVKKGAQSQTKIKAGAQTKKQASKTSQKTKQTAKQSSKIRYTQGGKQTVKSAIHTGKGTNRTVKTTKKGVKNTKKAVKTTRKGIKTTARTTKRTAQAAKRAGFIAKKAAVVPAKTIRLTVKAIIMAVKAAIAVVKGLIAIIAAGGWIVVIIIIIIAVIAAIVSSPLSIFANDTDGTTPTISEVVQLINGEYTNTITDIITDAGDVDEVIIEGESSSSEFHVGNWIDVIGVFSVKSTITSSNEEFIPLVYMEERQVSDLKDVFWNMNSISQEVIEEKNEPDPTPTPNPSMTPETPSPEPTPEICRNTGEHLATTKTGAESQCH